MAFVLFLGWMRRRRTKRSTYKGFIFYERDGEQWLVIDVID